MPLIFVPRNKALPYKLLHANALFNLFCAITNVYNVTLKSKALDHEYSLLERKYPNARGSIGISNPSQFKRGVEEEGDGYILYDTDTFKFGIHAAIKTCRYSRPRNVYDVHLNMGYNINLATYLRERHAETHAFLHLMEVSEYV